MKRRTRKDKRKFNVDTQDDEKKRKKKTRNGKKGD